MKLKKGSAAAKAYMAKIRAKRGAAKIGALPFTGNFEGVKFRAEYAPNGIRFIVGGTTILYKKGDTQTSIGERIANAIRAQSEYKFTDTEYRQLKSKFSMFAGTFKDDLTQNKTVVKKTAIKKPVTKKAVTKKAKVKAKPVQRGGSSLKLDLMRKAKAPGKRTSATGAKYYESRRNRSDAPGSMAGIGAINTDLGRKLRAAQDMLAYLVGQLANKKEEYRLRKSPAAKTMIPVLRKKIAEAKKVVTLLKKAYKK